MEKTAVNVTQERTRWIAWWESARVIWAITAKDLVGALKNKNAISVIITSFAMVFVYWGFPILTSRGENPNLLIYDEGDSTLTAYLENSQAFEVWTGFRSAEHMRVALANGDVAELGLVIPAGFDRALQSGDIPVLQGYSMHWVDPEDAVELQRTAEEEITQLLRVQVPVQTAGNQVYPAPDSGGIGVDAGFSVIFVVTMVGLTLIPHLMLEEKTSHTLEALLVSPASEGQVAAAKALTGLFYCAVGAAVALAVFNRVVVHWWLAAIAVICGSLFTIALGLWLGSVIENRGQMTMLAWVLIIPLFFPVFLSLMDNLIPATLIQVFRLVPTTVLMNLLRTSFAGSFGWSTPLLQLAWVLAWAFAALSLVIWQLRRRDREAGGPSSLWQSTIQKIFPTAHSGSRADTPLRPAVNRGSARPEMSGFPKSIAALPESSLPEKPPSSLHIVWAIAAKDIRSAVNNKLVLSIILGTAMIMLNGPILARLLGLRDTPTAVVYDEGRSTIVRALTGSDSYNLGIVDSREELEDAVTGSPATPLGLVIPADFDQLAGTSDEIELQGYTAHWADPKKIDQWKAVFEQELGLASWGTVQIHTQGNELYPAVEPVGQPLLNAIVIIVVIVTIGMALVSLLLIEEKETHTYEALMVSPANIYQLVAGKAIAGGFYCLAAALVAVLLTRHLFVHWGVTALAVLLGAAFAVGIGLFVGAISDSPSTTGLWAGLAITALVALTILRYLGNIAWPGLVQAVLQWQPGSAMIGLFGLSMAGEAPTRLLWANAAALAAAAALVYALTLGVIRRTDR